MSEGHWDIDRLAPILVTVFMPISYRIIANNHLSNPLGTSPSDSRFCTRNGGFTALYAVPEFATAFVETVVRDRFAKRQSCEVLMKEITAWGWVSLEMHPENKLKMIDLREDGCILGLAHQPIR